MARATHQQVIELIARTDKAERGLKRVSKSARTLNEALDRMGITNVRVDRTSKKLVSTTTAKVNVENTYKNVLTQSSKAVDRAEAEAKQLTQARGKETAATNAATKAHNEHQKSLSGMKNSSTQANFAVLSLSQAVQDGSQFQMGFAQGMRAVNNNIQVLAQSVIYLTKQQGGLGAGFKALASSIAGPGGVLLAFSLVSVAVEVISSKLAASKRKMEELEESASDLAKAFAGVFQTISLGSFDATDSQLGAFSVGITEMVREAEAARSAIDPLFGDPEEAQRLDARIKRLKAFQEGILDVTSSRQTDIEVEKFAAELGIELTDKKTGKVKDQLSILEQLLEKEQDLLDVYGQYSTEGPEILAAEKRIEQQEQQIKNLRTLLGLDADRQAAFIAAAAAADIAPEKVKPLMGGETEDPEMNLRGPGKVKKPGPQAFAEIVDEFETQEKRLERLADRFNQRVGNAMAQGVGGFLEGVGQFAAGTSNFDSIAQLALSTLADMAINVGKIAIGTGIAVAGIKKALQTLNPIAAIAAGTALVALGSMVKARLAKAAQGGSSSGVQQLAPSRGGASFLGGGGGLALPAPALQPVAPSARFASNQVLGVVRGQDIVLVSRRATQSEQLRGVRVGA